MMTDLIFPFHRDISNLLEPINPNLTYQFLVKNSKYPAFTFPTKNKTVCLNEDITSKKCNASLFVQNFESSIKYCCTGNKFEFIFHTSMISNNIFNTNLLPIDNILCPAVFLRRCFSLLMQQASNL